MAGMQAELESWGLVVELGDHVFDRWGYQAGKDHERLEDLNAALRDPRVRAVITSRGGAGAYRITASLDVAAVRADPKPVVGYSDITYLHLALWRACAVPGVHGAAVGMEAIASLRRLLMDREPVVAVRDPLSYSAQVHVAGRAEGPLLGGNLSSVTHLVGAGLPSLDGAVLLLEDTRGMGLGRVDRQLTQLRNSGALDRVAGIALGLFTGFDDYQDRGWTLLDVLADHLGVLGIPVLGGLRIGHDGAGRDGKPDQTCVAVGAPATLDTVSETLTSGPAAY